MEIKPRFTPGPYRIEDYSEDERVIVGKPNWGCKRFGVQGEWDIARIDDLLGDHPDEVAANARLFSVADKLFWFAANIALRDAPTSKEGHLDDITNARQLVRQVLG